MRTNILTTLVSLVMVGVTIADEGNQPPLRSLAISDFASALEPGQRILEEEDWMNWCMAPIYDAQGQVHLYYCRWTAAKPSAWLESAQIVHATAPKPEGPYTKQSVIMADDLR